MFAYKTFDIIFTTVKATNNFFVRRTAHGNDGKEISVMNIRNVDNAPYSEKHGTYGGASGFKDGLTID